MTTERTFDWVPRKDPRSLAFTASPEGATSARSSRYWTLKNPVLDQGAEGACVGHGMANLVSARPISTKLPRPQQTARGLYHAARFIDEYPGEADEGTSTTAGAKAVKDLGLADGYQWAFGIDQLRYTVQEVSAVGVGILWLDTFMEPGPDGLVLGGGSVVGGHFLVVTGYSARKTIGSYTGPIYRLRNSWSEAWGDGGNCWMPESILADRLRDQGEAVILTHS